MLSQTDDAIFEAFPDATLILDEDGYVLDANRAAHMLFSNEQQDLIGMRFDLESDAVQRVLGHGTVQYELQRSPLRWQGQSTILTVVRKIDRAFQEMANTLKEAVESANDSILITDCAMDFPGPRIEYVNPAFCAMTGYTPEEIIGQTPRVLQGPATDAELRKRLRHDLAVKGEFTGATVNYRKDGSYYDVEWRISAIRDDHGKVRKWVAIQRDVTERNRNELRLREADANKDEFLATLAHELRNPLAPLQTSLNLLQHAPTAERLAQTHAIMSRQLDYIVRLVDDLLDLARLKNGKIDLKRSRCRLKDSIDAAIEMSQTLFEAKNQRFIMEPFDPNVILDADPSRLTQMISNLLNNAAKYTNNQGRITLRVTVTDDQAILMVRDTGCGIAREMLGKIFDLYSQIERSRESSQGGLGIGLSLVKKLTELHGGTIDADSSGLGHGSTFTLRLPIIVSEDRKSMPPLAMEADGKPQRHTQRRVLIIDDNHDGADTLALLLELQGHQTRVAYSGPEGIDIARSYRPDVILSDIQLPGFDGCELARRIRTEMGHDIVLAAMTGWGTDEDRQRSKSAGFDHHLVKPVKSEHLEVVLQKPASKSRDC